MYGYGKGTIYKEQGPGYLIRVCPDRRLHLNYMPILMMNMTINFQRTFHLGAIKGGFWKHIGWNQENPAANHCWDGSKPRNFAPYFEEVKLDWFVGWLLDWVIGYCLIHWFIAWLIRRLIDWFVGCLIDWLIELLIEHPWMTSMGCSPTGDQGFFAARRVTTRWFFISRWNFWAPALANFVLKIRFGVLNYQIASHTKMLC